MLWSNPIWQLLKWRNCADQATQHRQQQEQHLLVKRGCCSAHLVISSSNTIIHSLCNLLSPNEATTTNSPTKHKLTMHLAFFPTTVVAIALGIMLHSTAPGVDAHGYVLKPVTQYTGQGPDSPIGGQHDAYKVLPPPSGVSYGGKAAENAIAFKTALQASNYKSLKDFILAVVDPKDVPKCAGTSPQILPDKIEFGYPPYNVGFIHEGPCEAWCDNERVMAEDNCAKTYGYYGKGLAQMTYDKAKCEGAKQFTYYWLNTDSASWQTYINCAALSGSSGDNNSGGSSQPASTDRPAADATRKPSPSTGPSPTSLPTKKPARCPRLRK